MASELREALTRAAAPVEIGPDDRHRVSDAIAADRRRRITMAAVGGTIAAVVAIGVGVAVVDGGRADDRPGVTDRGKATSGWERVAASPLAPRDQAVAVWTGSEVIVVGGTTGRPCSPDADCAPPPKSAERADGAAYDPATETWREIAPAPAAVAGGHALWWDDRMIVVSDRLTLAYDPAADQWQRLDLHPSGLYEGGLVGTDEGPVAFSYDQRPRADDVSDWRLDLATGEWSALPHDPFAESYDRSMAWHEDRLWLLSMDVEHHFGAHEGSPSRIAVLDGDTWTVVDEETPDLTYGQRLVQHQGSFVIAPGSYRSDFASHAFDPETGEWRTLPGSGGAERGCPLGDAIVGPAWVASGNGLYSASPADALAAPPCPGMPAPAVTVWAGDRLFIWGGPNPDYDGNLDDGWVWTPPPPE
ncbi:Kelch repeat-containing protein [Nocardioides bizhenqiangii]|uniref:Galactose oxidase n=1 Tax=Nocardioides bizhenqiangii TaxID=3095076 RepID=A0ABZ0ZNH1_9ACTN|nr:MULTISPECIES: hypothetical protein [unclassified Nocardioides]MDZ5621658.1 hypothetical protein [Nocardioides sp. HM23]WQQ25506.1 hypothetical protein SHK19_16245 [Nocardioides sp. HM61]